MNGAPTLPVPTPVTDNVPPRRAAWLVTLPLAAAGLLGAHELAYRLASPVPAGPATGHQGHDHTHHLAETGHGYLAALPAILAVCAGLLVAGLLVRVIARGRDAGARPSTLPFGLLAPLAFVLQEHLERWVQTGVFPAGAALEATFVMGLVLTLPVGLAACALARVLLGAADRLGAALAAPPPPLPHRTARAPRRAPVDLLRMPVLAMGRAGRAPPHPA